MNNFFKKLSGKTEKKSFKEIPLDRKATYKQQWAVAWRFARECADDFPYQSEKALAVIFNAVIYTYHSDPECNTELTHGDVQGYLNGEKSCPDYYKKLIHINLREELQKSDPDTKRRDSPKNYGQKSFDLSDENKVQQLIKLYKEGETLKNIGEVFGMSRGSVINYVKKLKDKGIDIELRGQGGASFDLSDENKVQQLIKLYKEGETLKNIGEVFGMSHGSVINYVKKLKDKGIDIELRGQGKQSNYSNSLDLSDERKVRRFIRMYQDGHTLDAIGDTFGMTAASVRNYVRRLKDKGVDIDFRGQGRRTDNLYPDHRRKRSINLNKEKSSNKKLLNIMNNQKRS